MPLPLYGSGGRIARTSAAIWPTTWRSDPLMTISVCVGHSTLMPAGMSLATGCEKPICKFSLEPAAWARKPTPTRYSRFSKPLLTPLTMFATSARIVPDIASASTDSLAGTKLTLPASFFTDTSGFTARVSVPSVPLTLIFSALTDTSTPCGTVIGIFPTRDISFSPLGDVAKDFAADTGLARLAIGHHALRRGDDGHTQTVHHVRDVVAALIDAQPRAADALDVLDYRAAGVVLQRHFELRLRRLADHGEALDIAFVLQDLGNRRLQLRRRHHDAGLLDHLRVANAGQHIGDRITHAHTVIS